MKTKLLIISCIFLYVNIIFAQDNTSKEAYLTTKAAQMEERINDVGVDVKISDKNKIETLKQTVRKALVDYYKYAHLWDETKDYVVNQTSINRFKELFDDNSKIVSDVSKYNGIVVPYENYASSVFDYMTAVGVDFDITSMVVDKIREDKTGFYKIDVLTTKIMYNGLENDNSVFKCKSGRRFDLIISFRIEKDNLEKAYISSILGNLVKDCEDAKPMWSYGLGGDFGLALGSTTSFFDDNMQGFILKKNPNFGVNLGASYYKPLTIKDKMYLKLGLQLQYRNLTVSIDSSTAVFTNYQQISLTGTNRDNDNSITFDRRVTIQKKFEENHHTISVAVPIGIYQKFYTNDDNTLRISAEVCLTPAVLITSISTWKGRLSYANSQFNFANIGYASLPNTEGEGLNGDVFGLKNNVYFSDADKSDKSNGVKAKKPDQVKLKFHPTVWFSISPIFEFIRSDVKSFYISPIISYSVLSFVKSNDSDKRLFLGNPKQGTTVQDIINSGTESTVMEDYLKSYNVLSFGINVGFLKKF